MDKGRTYNALKKVHHCGDEITSACVKQRCITAVQTVGKNEIKHLMLHSKALLYPVTLFRQMYPCFRGKKMSFYF